MDEFPVANRLKKLISSLGLSDSQFADKCAISRSTLSLLLAGKNKKISDILLSQIHDTFPQVSILWLLFGEGEMFKSEKEEENFVDENRENLKFSNNYPEEGEQLNLVNLKQLENVIQDVVNKTINPSFHTLENLVLKTNEPSFPRKVSKITVYYADSTFETFVPE